MGPVGGDVQAIASFVSEALAEVAVPSDAAPMAAYMKTEMPFHGVKRPARRPIERLLKQGFRPGSAAGYRAGVEALWALPHREEKYLAIAYARMWPAHIGSSNLDLYLGLVRTGAWWDLVDEVAAHLIGTVWLRERPHVSPRADAWVEDADLWVRRTALIGQLRHGEDTDHVRLFGYCLARASEREFFIRKAIGWALREYSRHDPARVAAFLRQHGDALSGLSRREASRRLPGADGTGST